MNFGATSLVKLIRKLKVRTLRWIKNDKAYIQSHSCLARTARANTLISIILMPFLGVGDVFSTPSLPGYLGAGSKANNPLRALWERTSTGRIVKSTWGCVSIAYGACWSTRKNFKKNGIFSILEKFENFDFFFFNNQTRFLFKLRDRNEFWCYRSLVEPIWKHKVHTFRWIKKW